jgi:hypothetical protein
VVGLDRTLDCAVERAFRCIKTVDLQIRPIYLWLADRVRAHVFVCMLAYYLEWHMRRRLAPMLYDDTDKDAGESNAPASSPKPSAPLPPSLSKPLAEPRTACRSTASETLSELLSRDRTICGGLFAVQRV